MYKYIIAYLYFTPWVQLPNIYFTKFPVILFSHSKVNIKLKSPNTFLNPINFKIKNDITRNNCGYSNF